MQKSSQLLDSMRNIAGYRKLTVSILIVFLFLSLSGCGKHIKNIKPTPHSKKSVTSTSNNIAKVNLSDCVYSRINYSSGDIGFLNSYKDLLIFSYGSGKPVKSTPPCLTYLNHIALYDTSKKSVIATYSADKGYTQILGVINEDWIALEEYNNEECIPQRIYVINRKTNRRSLVYKVDWIPKLGEEAQKTSMFLSGDNLYLEIAKFYKNDITEAEIRSINLSNGSSKVLLTKKFKYYGISFPFPNAGMNASYILFNCWNDYNESESFLYVFSIKENRVRKITLPDSIYKAQYPVVSSDNFVILEKYISVGHKDNKIIVSPVDKILQEVTTYDVDIVNIFASKDYIVGEALGPIVAINRHTGKISLINTKNAMEDYYEIYLSGDRLFIVGDIKDSTAGIVYLNLEKNGL